MSNNKQNKPTTEATPEVKASTKKSKAEKVKEPENSNDKKAAKATVGKTKGEGKAVKAAKDKAEKKPKGPGIGKVALGHLEAGKSAQETLELVKKQFPDAKTTISCIYWYANKNGIRLQKAAKPAEEKAA